MKRTYCAIYTRKSSDEGLEQEFNTLDAQREACESYIKSQKHEGWICLPEMYDDGGLSGGTMERPALKRLLADIQSGKVQTVVVYKVDRLTRSLANFAKIVDVLDAAGASFVSVTQQFNTTTSMGRLTLNMLLSFAQFEREIAGERIRDKIAASKARGMWMGGNVPLGYDVTDKKLVVNEIEAETVRLIFEAYADLGSVRQLRVELDRRGVLGKRREGATGALAGGKPYSRGSLYNLLQNPIYRGEIAHQGKFYPGQHQRIIDEELWLSVQGRLATNRHDQEIGKAAESPSLLAGLIFDGDDQPMIATHANKRGKRYRYYISKGLVASESTSGANAMRVPAGEVENLVVRRLDKLVSEKREIMHLIDPLQLEARQIERILANLEIHSDGIKQDVRKRAEFVRNVVRRVSIRPQSIQVELHRAAVASALAEETIVFLPQAVPYVLTIAAALKRAGKGKRIVIEADGPGVDPALVKLLRDAFSMWQAVCGDAGANHESAAWTSTYRARRIALLRLSYLAPSVVRTILNGQQPADLSAKRLMALSKDLPFDWSAQPAYLGIR